MRSRALSPALIAVAPNGARRTKADHPALPMTAAEIGRTAAACAEAGAAMIHLHVRDDGGQHSLDPALYRAAMTAVRREAGPDLVIQATTEAVGRYDRHQQMAMVRTLKPECVSIALREVMPDEASLKEGVPFLAELKRERIGVQYILYSAQEAGAFRILTRRGLVPDERPFVLFVLGRYAKDQTSAPTDLLPFLAAWENQGPFAVCAFGPKEGACALTALALDGHARVGFENNLALADGRIAPDNAALVRQTADAAGIMGRTVADPDQTRVLVGIESA
ncbi:MAG: 3-keto-5-aminohexanoate cleavage protein [Alphaproteobacteria bacterium]|nr:3-keto-5-aminohexanoate cleavage protein [Alphaproteobacteria bacterium]